MPKNRGKWMSRSGIGLRCQENMSTPSDPAVASCKLGTECRNPAVATVRRQMRSDGGDVSLAMPACGFPSRSSAVRVPPRRLAQPMTSCRSSPGCQDARVRSRLSHSSSRRLHSHSILNFHHLQLQVEFRFGSQQVQTAFYATTQLPQLAMIQSVFNSNNHAQSLQHVPYPNLGSDSLDAANKCCQWRAWGLFVL